MSDQPLNEARAAVQDSGGHVQASYRATRDRLGAHFDRIAPAVWARLTSDEGVSPIERNLRDGRAQMRGLMLSCLPEDLSGRRVLDAGCGAGHLSAELARRGADVLAVDLSPAMIDIAQRRHASANIEYVTGDMLDAGLGVFDHILALDSLIYYATPDLGAALSALKLRTARSIVFTVAPKTPLALAAWGYGRLQARANTSPVMVPQSPSRLERHLSRPLSRKGRVRCGLYVSDCLEVHR